MKNGLQFLTLFAIVVLVSSAAWAQSGPVAPNTADMPYAFNDANHDGICDITGQPVGSGRGSGKNAAKGKKYGPGDGTGNQGSGPADGTGYGAGQGKGSGNCDGTGPRRGGSGGRGGRGGRR